MQKQKWKYAFKINKQNKYLTRLFLNNNNYPIKCRKIIFFEYRI